MLTAGVRPGRVVAAGLLFWLCGRAGAESTWREVRSPHFRVVTDGSSKDGHAVANEFEQMRHVFALRFQREEVETGAPLTILALRDPDKLRLLGPRFWKERDRVAGQFFSGWERQFALVRLDAFGDLNQAVVFHEYTHGVMHANLHWLPTWLDEGFAEFYAYTRFQGDHIYVGAPSVRLGHLKSESPIPMKEMLQATSQTYAKDRRREDLFYGEAWAVVHYLTFAKEMGSGTKLQKFLDLTESGVAQTDAFLQCFGDFKTFDSGFSGYLLRLAVTAAVLPPDKGLDQKTFAERVLTPAEVDYDLGSLATKAGERETGRALLEKAVASDPGLAAAREELGFLNLDEGRDKEAKEEWEKAMALDPKRYRTAFALTMMDEPPVPAQTREELTRMQVSLKHVTELEPRFAPAYVELALVDWRLGKMQDAYNHALQAEKLQPWRAGYHLLVGHILLRGHQAAQASKYATLVATRWPQSDHNEAVDLWNELPAAARGDATTPALDIPADGKVVRGTILSTACSAEGKGSHLSVVLRPDDVAVGGAPLTLTAEGAFRSGFSDTLWWGEDHFSLCYHLAGLRALVAYKPAGAQRGTLMDFEIRDVLPTGDAVAGAAGAAHP